MLILSVQIVGEGGEGMERGEEGEGKMGGERIQIPSFFSLFCYFCDGVSAYCISGLQNNDGEPKKKFEKYKYFWDIFHGWGKPVNLYFIFIFIFSLFFSLFWPLSFKHVVSITCRRQRVIMKTDKSAKNICCYPSFSVAFFGLWFCVSSCFMHESLFSSKFFWVFVIFSTFPLSMLIFACITKDINQIMACIL